MKSCARIAIPALAVVLSLAACGSGQAARSSGSAPAADTPAGDTVSSTASAPAASTARKQGVQLIRLGSFDQPVAVTGAPGDSSRVFVVQRAGQIMLLLGGHAQARPFLDISSSVYTQGGEEQGLLGLAFPADYADSGLFYVDYTVPGDDIEVVQYRRSASGANLADPASARLMLDASTTTNSPTTTAGSSRSGPTATCTSASATAAARATRTATGRTPDTLLGKILRIAPVARQAATRSRTATRSPARRGKRAEIWAYGLRNPWRFSFDRATGDMIDRRRRAGRAGGDRLRRRRAPAPAPTTAGACGRATVATSPATRRALYLRRSPLRTATATARSSAATSCAIARCRASTAATCSATSAARRSSR